MFLLIHFMASYSHRKDWNYELRAAIVFQEKLLFHLKKRCCLNDDTPQQRQNQFIMIKIMTAVAVVVITESAIILVDAANAAIEAN